jgi:hypothetical protein
MESFEHLCKVALEADGFVVTGNVKFFVARPTKKASYAETQTHGYEVDLVGARSRRLVLAEVKSYLGSGGVGRQFFRGLADESKRHVFERYKLLNDEQLRQSVVDRACEQYGYTRRQVEMRFYVGRFRNGHEDSIREHLASFVDPPVRIVALTEIVDAIIGAGSRRTYTDDPVVMTVKALAAAGRLPDLGRDVPV